MKFIITALLLAAAPVLSAAEDLSGLQRQTNTAYEQMKQAEKQAGEAKKELQIKQDNLRYYQEKVAETEKEFQAAQQALQNTEENLSAAKKRWNNYSEELYQKWRQ